MLKIVSFAAGLLILAGGAAAAVRPATPAQATAVQPADEFAGLPEGVGRETTARVCTQCHAIGMVTSQKHSRDEWNDVIVRMIEDQGLSASEEELTEISAYLAEHFGREAPKAH
jgi:cytochrome c5